MSATQKLLLGIRKANLTQRLTAEEYEKQRVGGGPWYSLVTISADDIETKSAQEIFDYLVASRPGDGWFLREYQAADLVIRPDSVWDALQLCWYARTPEAIAQAKGMK